MVPHVDDGPTTTRNGAPMCGHHNRWKTHGYTTHRDHDGHWHHHRPDGTEIGWRTATSHHPRPHRPRPRLAHRAHHPRTTPRRLTPTRPNTPTVRPGYAAYHDVVLSLRYPSPDLIDGPTHLRTWRLDDLACIEEASTDRRIPEGTTVPDRYTPDEGRAFIERQWSRVDNGEGVSLAISSASTRAAIGLIVLTLRPQEGVAGVGYWVVPSHRGQGHAARVVGSARGRCRTPASRESKPGSSPTTWHRNTWSLRPGSCMRERSGHSCRFGLDAPMRWSSRLLPSVDLGGIRRRRRSSP